MSKGRIASQFGQNLASIWPSPRWSSPFQVIVQYKKGTSSKAFVAKEVLEQGSKQIYGLVFYSSKMRAANRSPEQSLWRFKAHQRLECFCFHKQPATDPGVWTLLVFYDSGHITIEISKNPMVVHIEKLKLIARRNYSWNWRSLDLIRNQTIGRP